ncbi:histone deacetylase family protein [Candidatus Parabeggiatoa sp. HSG14]|uniref:histone deacetylase family protein n=1 Tax=Candidatus Parabeggiatoa sp. HSG14 TaxID=3055593 RepID=UPI0025A76818|nr:histone deacetylase family protein [Thiotrichales bacterium HSG14]
MPLAYLYHPDCLLHDMGTGHPERPSRISAIEEKLRVSHLMDLARYYEAPLATRQQLARVHGTKYIDTVLNFEGKEGYTYLDPDTMLTPQTPQAALRAAGALTHATDLVLTKKHNVAFCNIRPPGHHALRNQAMGFCFFNNVAVGVAHAIEEYGLERVAIMDFDVHHGNGTEEIFANDPRVMLCSTFQHPFYPGSGADTVSDHIINVPLPAGTTGEKFREAVTTQCLPALHQFAPQLIFISAGFDAHEDDGISMMRLQVDDYIWVTQQMLEIADKYAEGQIVSTLEGGYELQALAQSVAAHLKVLIRA